MYKIKVRNNETGLIWWEYGFTNFIMKRIHFLFNETDNDFYDKYSILEIIKIYCTFSTFKKCLTNHTDFIFKELIEE